MPENTTKHYLPVSQDEKNNLPLIPSEKPALNLADSLIAILIIGPCTVGFWRGTWLLIDYYKFPHWESLMISFIAHIVFIVFQDIFIDIFKKKPSTLLGKILKRTAQRIYTYIYALVCVFTWRSLWEVIDKQTDLKLHPNVTASASREGSGALIFICIGCFISIIGLKGVVNLYAPPFVIARDELLETFAVPTRFNVKLSEKTSLYILDCLFSVLIVGTLVVFVWRGAWVLLDIFIFPENEVWSAWASLVVGYAGVAIAFMLQPFMRWLCERITGGFRLLAADLFLIFSLIGTVNVWRGIWNLLNIYFLTDDMELSCWVTHFVSLIILILLGCSNSLLVRGVYIDAEEPGGKCVVFPCYYLRLIFQEQKLKKNLKNEQNKEKFSNLTELSSVKTVENNHIAINNDQLSNHHHKQESGEV